MIFPGHIAAGYIVSQITLGLFIIVGGAALLVALPHTEVILLLALGTLLGDAPDIDVFYNFYRQKTLTPKALPGHRTHITHAPLFWLVVGLAIFGLGYLMGSYFIEIVGVLLWVCPWSHFLCDSIEHGIMWLWPFSTRQFALRYTPRKNRDLIGWRALFAEYSRTPVAWAELALVVIALCLLLFRPLSF